MPDTTQILLADCRARVSDAWSHQDRFDATLAQAETRLRDALADEPDNPLLLTSLGAVLCDRGQFRDAAAMLQHAVHCGSQDANAFFNLGVAQQGSGAGRAAMTAFGEAARRVASLHTWAAYFDPHAS